MKRVTLILTIAMLAVSSTVCLGQDEAKKKKGAATKAKPKKVIVSAAEAKVAAEHFDAGRRLFFQGKFGESVKKLQQAVGADPTKTSFKLLLAKAYRFAKQDEKAVEVLSALVKANPDHVDAAVQLAELLSPTKDPDRVIAVLEPLLKYKHDYPLYSLLARSYYEKENFEKARGYYQEAIKLNGNHASDHYQIGNIYLARKRFARAAQSYERAEQLGYSSGAFHFKLASVYFNLHRYLGAVTESTVVGGKVGDINRDMYLIGAVPGKKDRFYVAGRRSAIFQVVKAKQQGIDIFDIHFLEANVWMSARRYKQANKIYAGLQEKVKKQDAGLFWSHWSETALGLNDYEGYISRLQKAIEADPEVYKATLSDAYVTVANRYNGQGNSAKFIEFLVKAVETNPLSARLHLNLGDAYWLASKSGQAIAQYKLVLELEPDHGERVRLLNRIRGKAE